MVQPRGIEPLTIRLESECSIQLSYGCTALSFCDKRQCKGKGPFRQDRRQGNFAGKSAWPKEKSS